ncbi:maleylpyruvate isomerase family mycothiol-dependent enzyme, partial [Nonomuraea wenchangensis]|uniref:maleylpyruvate isomerase family mycothiol-dependent enzyme n=1 Tax=Nonomuraea wenchangensis TaxID=568860 RepID=UPI003328CAB8
MNYEPQIEQETERLAELAELAGDLSAPVPSCPGWTMAELVTHVGQTHRWAVHVLRERVQERIWSRQVPSGLPEGRDGDAGWLRAGAAELVRTLRETDPDLPVWTWGPDRRAAWWPRRMAYELVVHRVDGGGRWGGRGGGGAGGRGPAAAGPPGGAPPAGAPYPTNPP